MIANPCIEIHTSLSECDYLSILLQNVTLALMSISYTHPSECISLAKERKPCERNCGPLSWLLPSLDSCWGASWSP